MRKPIKIIFIALLFVFFGFMLYQVYTKLTHKQQIAENIQNIPAFYFYDMQDSLFTDADLLPGKATLIIHFHPDCEHCRYEAKAISEQINKFTAYQLVWISYADKAAIQSYAKEFQLAEHGNITFLHDKDMVFNEIFGKGGIPTSFIYNKSGKLLKQFKGEVKPDALLKYLKVESP